MKNTLPTVVRAADLAAYSPANHTGTSNVRVIGPETVGATALEVLVGTIVKSHGAKPHAHPYLEQCAYMIEGTGESQAQGRVEVMGPGTWTYVPAGVFHSFRVTSDQPGRLLVVYAPPYGENPAHTITEPDPAVPARAKSAYLPPPRPPPPTVALIDRDSVGAQWVEIEALRMAEGSALSCARGRTPSRCFTSKMDKSMRASASRTSSSRRATSCFFRAGPVRPCAARRAGGHPASSSKGGFRLLLRTSERSEHERKIFTQLTTSSGAPLPLTGLPQAARRIGPVGYIRGNGADGSVPDRKRSTDQMKNDSSQGGPLAGLRIIDITEVVMGPSATQMLADLGADVIKVEPPGGDMLRATGPGGRAGAGPLFLNLNRNKRSIVLDLKRPAGKEALLKLAETADALVYNVRPQAMKRLGLDYEAVRQVNPRIVYVGTFGFSQRGRYAALRAFDDLIQAAVAIPEASVRAGSDVPRYAPLNLSDRATGLYAFGVICAALLARERTGRGQAVDVPMFETTAQMMLGDHLYGHRSSRRAAASAIRGCSTRSGGRTPPRTAWCASWSTPTSSGSPSCARSARPSGSRATRGSPTANRARSMSSRSTRFSLTSSERRPRTSGASCWSRSASRCFRRTRSSRCSTTRTCRTSGSSSNSSIRPRACCERWRCPASGRKRRCRRCVRRRCWASTACNCWPRPAIRAEQIQEMVQAGVTQVTPAPSDMEVAA